MNQPDSSADQMKKPLSGSRKGILVLGMHRSGTSALTRVLHLLGCQLPQQVMGGGVGNEAGHWESQRITSFNDEVLASAGSSWDDWLPFNPDWYQSPVFHDFVSRGRTLLMEEFGRSSLFVLKDPRICRLARLWLAIFAAEGVEPAIVLPVRNPVEVGHSLNERDMMEPGYAHLLWLRHFLDAEIATRGLKRVFCAYEQLLDNWPTLLDNVKVSLALSWPRVSASVDMEISSFLQKEFRHHSVSPNLTKPQVSQWISRTLEIALRWSDSGETETDAGILDSIKAEFDAASPAFAHLLLPGSRSGIAGDGSRRRAELEEQLADAQARALEETQQKQESIEELNQLRTQIANSESEIARLSDNARTFGEQLARNEALLGERDALAHRLADLESTIRQRDDEISQAHADLANELETKKALQADLERLIGEAEQWSGNDAIACRLADVESGLRRREEEIAQARAELSAEREAKTALQADLERLTSEAEQWSGNDSIAYRLADVESALRQREEETAQAWAELSAEREAKTALQADLERLAVEVEERSRKLAEADAWVYKLAGDRQAAERQADWLTSALNLERRQRAAAESASERLKVKFEIAREGERRAVVGLQQAHAEIEALRESLSQVPPSSPSPELERQVAEADQRLAEISAELDKTRGQQAEISAELDKARGQQDALAVQLRERFDEIVVLSQLLQREETRAEEEGDRAEWLREVSRALMGEGEPWWRRFMPVAWRRKRELRRLFRRGLFDGDAYLAKYPDVAREGMDPLRHYILHGMGEGRSRII